jgi:hypothetical protein
MIENERLEVLTEEDFQDIQRVNTLSILSIRYCNT